MTRAMRTLLTIYDCDYRVLEAVRECGCQPNLTRCLLSRGDNPRDRNEVTTSNCIRCVSEPKG